MRTWARRLPLTAILLLDVVLIVGVIALRTHATNAPTPEDAYEAAMWIPYFVAALVLLQIVLCIIGYITDKGPWRVYLYPGHLVASIVLFLMAELG